MGKHHSKSAHETPRERRRAKSMDAGKHLGTTAAMSGYTHGAHRLLVPHRGPPEKLTESMARQRACAASQDESDRRDKDGGGSAYPDELRSNCEPDSMPERWWEFVHPPSDTPGRCALNRDDYDRLSSFPLLPTEQHSGTNCYTLYCRLELEPDPVPEQKWVVVSAPSDTPGRCALNRLLSFPLLPTAQYRYSETNCHTLYCRREPSTTSMQNQSHDCHVPCPEPEQALLDRWKLDDSKRALRMTERKKKESVAAETDVRSESSGLPALTASVPLDGDTIWRSNAVAYNDADTSIPTSTRSCGYMADNEDETVDDVRTCPRRPQSLTLKTSSLTDLAAVGGALAISEFVSTVVGRAYEAENDELQSPQGDSRHAHSDIPRHVRALENRRIEKLLLLSDEELSQSPEAWELLSSRSGRCEQARCELERGDFNMRTFLKLIMLAPVMNVSDRSATTSTCLLDSSNDSVHSYSVDSLAEGGGIVFGSSDSDMYPGDSLAGDDSIVVTEDKIDVVPSSGSTDDHVVGDGSDQDASGHVVEDERCVDEEGRSDMAAPANVCMSGQRLHRVVSFTSLVAELEDSVFTEDESYVEHADQSSQCAFLMMSPDDMEASVLCREARTASSDDIFYCCMMNSGQSFDTVISTYTQGFARSSGCRSMSRSCQPPSSALSEHRLSKSLPDFQRTL